MRFLSLLVVLLLSGALSGQGIRQIGSNQGLEHPSVYAVAADEIGFIWLGTRDGLYRFNDGTAQKVAFLDSTSVRRSTNVQSLCVAHDSTLWIGLQQGGLVALDLSNLRPISDSKIPQLPVMSSVVSLFEDTTRTLWAGTVGDGVYRLTSGSRSWERIAFSTAPEDVAFAFDFAQQGDTLWLATSGSRLLYWDMRLGIVRAAVQNERYTSYRKMVDVSEDMAVWAVEEQGVFVHTAKGEKSLPVPEALVDQPTLFNPRDILIVDGDIWVSTDGAGLWRWRENNWTQFTKKDPQQGLVTDQFYNITRIKDQLWVGSFNGGVTLVPLRASIAKPIRKPSRFIYTSIQSALTLQDVGQELWVGFDGEGLVRYAWNSEALLPLDFELEEQPRVITSIHWNGANEVWIGTFNEGIFVVDSSGQLQRRFVAFSEISAGLGNNNIWSIAPGLGDSLYIGTLGGLYVWDGEQMSMPWKDPWALGRNILDIERVGSEIWVATEFQGVYSIKADGSYSNLSIPYPVFDLHHYQGYLFIGTEGGGLYRRGQDGVLDTLILPDNYATCYAIEDFGGDIYALTSMGLMQFDATGGLKHQFTQESLECGLFNRKALISIGEHLYIGGAKGIVEFIPNPQSNVGPSRLAITGVALDNVPVSGSVYFSGTTTQQLEIDAGNKTIEVQYELLSQGLNTRALVEYRVLGLSNEWSELSPSSRSVSLSNLDPGVYSLEFRVQNELSSASTVLSLQLVQKAFYHQKLWFKWTMGILIFLGFAGIAAVIQERQLRATRLNLLETEKELLATKATAMEAKAKEKSDELNFQLLKTSSRVELLKEFKQRLEQETSKPNRSDETVSMLRGLIRELNRELQSENYWDNFEQNYRDLHDEFSERLVAIHQKLTKGEVRLSYLIRQKMNNKEIATVLNVSPAAVEKAKYRLKKKIELSKTDSLDDYIQGL